MSGNSFGKNFVVTSFGESHSAAIGCIIDGCPPQVKLAENDIQKELDRRKPGQSDVTTSRNEPDRVEILSGVFEGLTTGTPIALIIYNKDQKSADYSKLKDTFRPNHADITYQTKYGIRDYRGGGRSSARETAMRVAAGAVAKIILKEQGISIDCCVHQIGAIVATKHDEHVKNKFNFCDESKISDLEELFSDLSEKGDSVGAGLKVRVTGCPVGLGEPVFDKLDADLAKAIMSINAVKSVSFGNANDMLAKKGSEIRDEMDSSGYLTNNSGGILGGISNGNDIDLNFIIKPTSSIRKSASSVNLSGAQTNIEVNGRHDPCVGIRAVPIAEAMVALTLLDHFMRNKAQCFGIDQVLPFKDE